MSSIHSIQQRRWLWGRVSYELRDDGTVASRRKFSSATREDIIYLADLDPNPVASRSVARVAWGCAVVFFGLFVWSVTGIESAEFEPGAADAIALWVMAVLFLACPAVYCAIRARRESYDILVFRGLDVGIVLLRAQPDAETVQRFAEELRRRIQTAPPSPSRLASPASTIPDGEAGDLWMLTELHRRGILDEESFAEGKRRLLVDAGAPIGFARE